MGILTVIQLLLATIFKNVHNYLKKKNTAEISHAGQQNPVVDQPQSFVASNDPQQHLLGPPGSFLPVQGKN